MAQPDIPGLLDKLHGLYSDFETFVMWIVGIGVTIVGIIFPIALTYFLKKRNDYRINLVTMGLEKKKEEFLEAMNKRVDEEVKNIMNTMETLRSELLDEIEQTENLSRGMSLQLRAQLHLNDSDDSGRSIRMAINDLAMSVHSFLGSKSKHKKGIFVILDIIVDVLNMTITKKDLEDSDEKLGESINKLIFKLEESNEEDRYTEIISRLRAALAKALGRDSSNEDDHDA